MRRESIGVCLIGDVFKDLCVHNALHILQQGRADGICIDTACKVHRRIVTIAEFLIGFTLPAAGKGRCICYSRHPRHSARVGDGCNRTGCDVSLGAQRYAPGRHCGRTIIADFGFLNRKKLDAGRRLGKPAFGDVCPRRTGHHQVAGGPLRTEHPQANRTPQVEQRCAHRGINKTAVVDIFQDGENNVQDPCKDAQKQAERAAHGQVCFCSPQLPCFIFQRIQQFGVSWPPEAA